jgi:ATP-binding cassette subfamily B protein
VSAQRVLEVLDTEPSIIDGTRTQGVEGHAGSVEFRDVSFAYPDAQDNVLEHVNFSVSKGQTMAFIGSTGSGKTTLLNLLMRFYDPSSGVVSVDGVDIREYQLKALRSKIGYVPQQSVMFRGTVRSNVAYGGKATKDTSTEQTLEDVKHASSVAQATEFVEQLPESYEAPVAQGGSNFSGGQKQRLSIARAVWSKPEILVFDDSFSALDFKTDREVRDALAKNAADSTMLIVAQRIGTIMDADQIMVLDEGKVVGLGTHKELLNTCAVYKQIAQSQLSEKELTA